MALAQSSASFAADGSLGQWVGGVARRSHHRVESGYWADPVTSVLTADLDCDCQVDIVDVQLVANLWRCVGGDDYYNGYWDVNGDDRIDVIDIMFVVAHWGGDLFLTPARAAVSSAP